MPGRNSQADPVVGQRRKIGFNQLNERVVQQSFFYNLDYIITVFKTDYGIDAGRLFKQSFAQSLRQAASDNDFAHTAFLFLPDCLSDCVKRLIFGRRYKAAGIYNNDVGVIGVLSNNQARTGNLRQNPLAIDHILGTAQGDKTDSNATFISFCTHRRYNKVFDGFNKTVYSRKVEIV
jgi:hypothetical protein